MGDPVRISEVLPGVLADIERRMIEAEREHDTDAGEREQDQGNGALQGAVESQSEGDTEHGTRNADEE